METLTCCAVIVILAAITTTGYLRSKDAARKTDCIARMSNIGKALLMYTGENDGYVPPYITEGRGDPKRGLEIPSKPKEWRDSFAPYGAIKQEFFCPMDRTAGFATPHGDDEVNSLYTSYMTLPVRQGQDIFGPDGSFRLNIDSIKYQEQGYAGDLVFRVVNHEEHSDQYLSVHGDTTSILYFDGRVKHQKISE